MLNISKPGLKNKIDYLKYASFKMVYGRIAGKILIRLMAITFGIFLVVLFLPWTQNIQTRGYVTALKPEHRPQTIQSVIGGRIEKWYVQEGDFVAKGDTILFISDTKESFFDPNLLERTQDQINANESKVKAYDKKIVALDVQIESLKETANLKVEQAQNYLQQANLLVISDSIDFEAAMINYDIAFEQLKRMEELYEQGLKSLTDLEARRMNLQKAQASKISAENKLLTSRNKVINAKVELVSLRAQYENSIAKAESDKFSAYSNLYSSEAEVTKLENQFVNYTVRSGMYFVTAPVDGYITQAIQAGIGETIKEGQEIISLMPANYELAIEMYVKPLDLPLLVQGQPVRIQFDGWPAIIFSGWPNTSYGTYGGRVFAIDNFISDNGFYRVLVKPDYDDHPWPDALRLGAGTYNLLLLKDVPIWYELWRQVNGFPPDYYKPQYVLDKGEKIKQLNKVK